MRFYCNTFVLHTDFLCCFSRLSEAIEPLVGVFPEHFDADMYNDTRKSTSFHGFVPSVFSRRVGPMRLPQDIPQDEQVFEFVYILGFYIVF